MRRFYDRARHPRRARRPAAALARVSIRRRSRDRRPLGLAIVKEARRMIVLRKTMDAAVELERSRYRDLAERFGHALSQVTALQEVMSAWVRNEPGDITP